MNLKNFIKNIIPTSMDLPLRYSYFKYFGRLDDEIAILENELKKCNRAIDIGANIGIYSYALSKLCKHVESFEPMPECAKMLTAYANSKNITVHNIGLSNKTGNTDLYVPLIRGDSKLNIGLASVNDCGGERECFEIPIQCLDNFNFSNVDFIKIDVEGHELEVIEGALVTIRREKPIILVEIEQRHLATRKIEDVFSYILSLGYNGGFYRKMNFYSLNTFSYEVDQEPYLNDINSKSYINNFIFRPLL